MEDDVIPFSSDKTVGQLEMIQKSLNGYEDELKSVGKSLQGIQDSGIQIAKNNLRGNFRMKKTYVYIILLMMLFLITGSHKETQAAENNMFRFLRYYKAHDYTNARKYFNKMSEYTVEKCARKLSSKRKKAYKKIIKKFKKYEFGHDKYLNDYYYTDIDNNGNAELILVTGTTAWQRMWVYKYKKGKAVKIASKGIYHQTLYSYPGHKGIVSIHCLDFGENVGVIYLSKGKLKYKSYGSRNLYENDYFYGHGMLKGHLR